MKKDLTIVLILLSLVLSFAGQSAAELKGGVVVKIGLDNSITELRKNEQTLVCGLDTSASKVEDVRQYLTSRDLNGPITVARFDAQRLPFAENIVNLLIADELGSLTMDEVMRVLTPNGTAIVSGKKTVKPWPKGMDEWTHYLRDATNNAVSKDVNAGHPTSAQWVDGPKYGRMHESLRRITSIVTAKGKLFTILDEGNDQDISMPPVWRLVCRDAFNGVILWRRDLVNWADYQRYFRSGPVDLAHRLVAVDNKVYVTMGLDQPVSILDATTGKTLTTIKGSENAAQILCEDNELVIMTDSNIYHGSISSFFKRRGNSEGKVVPQQIMLTDATTGKIKWSKAFNKHIFTTVSLSEDKVVFQTAEGVTCLDRKSGKQLWSTPAPFVARYQESGGHETHTMVVYNGVAIAAGGKKKYAISLKDGKILWDADHHSGYNSAPPVFVFDKIGDQKGVVGPGGIYQELLTGKEVKRNMSRASGESPTLSHERCYRIKATNKYLLTSRSGVELHSLASEDWGKVWLHHWIRGECQYGIMPANGMLYIPTDPCACNLQTKLNGNWALTPRKPAEPWEIERLVKGPAYGKVTPGKPAPWPTYRSNNQRSAATGSFSGKTFEPGWNLPLKAKLSGITVGSKFLFVAAIDRHEVYAIDRNSGKVAWTFTAGGRVDSPPTLYKGMAIFGCADGHVYALRQTDGKLAWRFMAAPEDRRIVSFGQLESAWPVHGSVLIDNGTLIASAGRQTYIDGGIHVYKMDPVTGTVKSKSVLNSIDPETGRQPKVAPELGGVNLQGTQNDVLSAIDGSVYMRHMKVDFSGKEYTGKGDHLFSEVGFLDDTQWYRCYWIYGQEMKCGYGGWPQTGSNSPSGRIMAFDDNLVCGYGRGSYPGNKSGQWAGGEKYRLYAMKKNDLTITIPGDPNARKPKWRLPTYKSKYVWEKSIPVMARAMTIAKDKIILAGLPDPKPNRDGRVFASEADAKAMTAVYAGDKGGVLAVHDANTGDLIAETKLAAEPVFDGMAVASDTVYISLKNGDIVSFQSSEK